MKIKYVFVLFTFLFVSCDNNSKLPALYSGKWVIDTTKTSAHCGFSAIEIELRNDGIFSYKWSIDDVGNHLTGVYYVNDNPNRYCKTISLIPSMIIVSHGDSLRIKSINLDFLEGQQNQIKILPSSNINESNINNGLIFLKRIKP